MRGIILPQGIVRKLYQQASILLSCSSKEMKLSRTGVLPRPCCFQHYCQCLSLRSRSRGRTCAIRNINPKNCLCLFRWPGSCSAGAVEYGSYLPPAENIFGPKGNLHPVVYLNGKLSSQVGMGTRAAFDSDRTVAVDRPIIRQRFFGFRSFERDIVFF